MRISRTIMLALTGVGLLAAAGPAGAAVLLVDYQDVTGGTNPLNFTNSEYIIPASATYSWSAATVSADLDLGSYRIVNSTNSSTVTFNLLKGGVNGAITGSGTVAFDFQGYNRSLRIYKAASIDVAGLITTAGGRSVGSITIGETSDRVGYLSIGGLSSTATHDDSYSYAGNVTIEGRSDVLIQDGSNVAKDILTYGNGTGGIGYGPNGGAVSIKHDGNFLAANIETWSSAGSRGGNNKSAGSVTLNGDILNDSASGTLTVTGIDAHKTRTADTSGSIGNGGTVNLSGYTKATIGAGGILTYAGRSANLNTGNGGTVSITGIGSGGIDIAGPISTYVYAPDARAAGNVTLACSGNIVLSGLIDASNYAGGGTQGSLSATSSAGSVTLASLDLDTVADATFSAALNTTITGALLGFSAGDYNGLDAATGQKIYYDPAANTGNADLAGQSYTLASGGQLLAITPEPATLAFLAAGGLAMAATGLRRRRA